MKQSRTTPSNTSWSKQELIDALVHRGPKYNECVAFIYNSYKASIIMPRRRFIPDTSILEEVFHDSLLCYLEALKKGSFVIKDELSVPKSLYSIFHKKTIDWYRKGKVYEKKIDAYRRSEIPSQQGIDEWHNQQSDALLQLVINRAAPKIRAQIKALPGHCSEILALKYGIHIDDRVNKAPQKNGKQPLGNKEIAERIGKSAKRIGDQERKCRKKLFKEILINNDPDLKEVILDILQNPRFVILLDVYWLRGPAILRHLNKLSRTEREETKVAPQEYLETAPEDQDFRELEKTETVLKEYLETEPDDQDFRELERLIVDMKLHTYRAEEDEYSEIHDYDTIPMIALSILEADYHQALRALEALSLA